MTKGSEAQNWQALRISHNYAYYQTILLEDLFPNIFKLLVLSCQQLSFQGSIGNYTSDSVPYELCFIHVKGLSWLNGLIANMSEGDKGMAMAVAINSKGASPDPVAVLRGHRAAVNVVEFHSASGTLISG